MIRPRSGVAGIQWPAVPANAGASLLALQWQFERSERLAPAALARLQFEQLGPLLAHCVAQAPFWRARLGEAGIRPGMPVTEEAWRRLPVLTRAEVQELGPALQLAAPAAHGKVARSVTSGSTGAPVACFKTELSQFFWHAAPVREALWHGWDPAGRFAAIREDPRRVAPPPEGLALNEWGTPMSLLFRTGPADRLDMQSPIDDQARWLARVNPDMLLSWPSNLAALAHHCLEHRIRPGRLRVVRTLGETVSPMLRALCRDAWGAPLVDAYSAEEVGYIALQCPTGEHYHVLGEDVLVEVLDDRGEACRPGEVGRVIVTPLHNFAMPLLRYEIGDDAELGPECACGRGLPVLARILGRTRDRLMLPNGERLPAYNPSEAFAAIPAIQRYQIAQTAPNLLEIRLVARTQLTNADRGAIDAALAAALGHRFRLAFVYRDAFPRGPGQKFRDVVCEIA